MFNLIGTIFNELFFRPIVNGLVLTLSLTHSLGLSIVILTILIRFLVWPFISSQLRSARKMTELKPFLDELKKKHESDKMALHKAQQDLFKEHGVSQASGCLPTLIQIPVFIALVNVISAFVSGPSGLERINQALYIPALRLNELPNLNFLGYVLTDRPSNYLAQFLSNPASLLQVPIPILLIPLLTATLAFIQSKMMAPQAVKKYPSDSPKEKKEKDESEDMMVAMQSQMMVMMPLMFGYLAFTFPIGMALYYNTFTLVGIIQQYLLFGWGGLSDLVSRFKKV